MSCSRSDGEHWEQLVWDREGTGRLSVAIPEDAGDCFVWAAGAGRSFVRIGPVDPKIQTRLKLPLGIGSRVSFGLREGATGDEVLKGTMQTVVEWRPRTGQEWVRLPDGLLAAESDRNGRWFVDGLRPGRGSAYRITCHGPDGGELVLKLADLVPGRTIDLGTLDLWRRTRVCGRVEPAPRPWEDVRVFMRPVDESRPSRSLSADGRGWFCFDDAQAGRPTLVWTVDDLKAEGQAVSIVPPVDDLVVRRPQPWLLRGRVMAEDDGAAIQEFTVTVSVPPVIPGLPETRMSEEIRTLLKRRFRDPSGRFEVPLPPSDAFSAEALEVRVEAPDYAPRSVEVGNTPSGEPLEITLYHGAELDGNVSTRWGQPVEGTTIRLNRVGESLPTTDVARSDGEGNFSIPHLEPGRYSLEASHPDFLTLRRVLDIQDDVAEVSLVLEEGRPLRGTVVARTTQEPVRGARLTAEWDGGSATGLSREDGSFELEPAPLDQAVTLFVAAQGFSSWSGTLGARAGSDGGGIRIELDDGKEINGRVLGLGGDGSGASVWLSSTNDSMVYTATTQTGGRFRVAGQFSGVIAYTVRHPSLSRNCRGTVSIPNDGETELVLNCDQPGVEVSGSVIRGDGSGAVGVHLLLVPAGSSGRSFATVTNQTGAFSFENVPPGEYSVLAVETGSEKSALLWSGYVPSSGLDIALRLPSGW